MSMKKLILGIIIGISCTALIGAGIENYVVSKKTAEVDFKSGLYIFTDSKPVMDYEYLGTISVMTWQGYYNQAIPLLLKKAKEKYPSADAIIYVDTEKADVIKFK